MGNGIVLDWLTFDEGYGCRPAFLAELDVLADYVGWAKSPSRSAV